jgi:hypothetical protein
MINVIDQGKQYFFDEDYARCVNRFEVVFGKLIELALNLSRPISEKIINYHKEQRSILDSLESLTVVCLLEHYDLKTQK